MMQLQSDEIAKLAQLRRVKRFATAALVVCLATYIGARVLGHIYPAWLPVLGFVAAFAEAATIGGLADWYAVVALFRHPLGLKIPHTAIIPRNQDKIADNLGGFLERNFLSEKVVQEKLGGIDFARHVTEWLGDRKNASELSSFVVHMVPGVLSAIEDSGFKDFAAKRVTKQLEKTEIAPVAVKLIDSFVKDGRYQALLDEIIDALSRMMHDEKTLKTIQERVADELPTLLYVFQADSLILKRIVRSSNALLLEVKKDPEHPLREEFSELFEDYVERMKSSKRFARRVERFKQEFLARPEIADFAGKVWNDLGEYIATDASRSEPVLARELSGLLVDLSRSLQKDGKLTKEINAGLTASLSELVSKRKSDISLFVSDQVKSWDFRQLVTLIEANVGKDLQYIRFNGMLIGGAAGVLLHLFDISILPR